VAAARHAAFWALNRAGLNPAQIARYLGLNHSTVVHGLARAEQHPEWRALVAPAIQQVRAGGEREAAKAWLTRELRAHRCWNAARSATTSPAPFWAGAPFGQLLRLWLWLVLRRPWYRTSVEAALRHSGLEHEIGRIDLHASCLGYRAADGGRRRPV